MAREGINGALERGSLRNVVQFVIGAIVGQKPEEPGGVAGAPLLDGTAATALEGSAGGEGTAGTATTVSGQGGARRRRQGPADASDGVSAASDSNGILEASEPVDSATAPKKDM
jgi:hypothetical protein